MSPDREARWTNPYHPQTLQIAVFLLYATVFFFALGLLTSSTAYFRSENFPWGPLLVASAVGALLAGRGIASNAKWGYQLGLAVAVFPFVFRVLYWGSVNAVFSEDIIGLMFEIALVALLVHPESRNYQRIWFT